MTVYIIISIDLETPQTPLRRKLLHSECLDPVIDGIPSGYSCILRMLSRFRVPGVFFVNVYEASLWGNERMAEVCRTIHDAGSEVGLHTHPEWIYDPFRIYMWQYTLDEQVQIIKDGIKLIQNWLPGYQIVSHRAGAYGSNEQTIDALQINGVPVDSSVFYRHPNCKLTLCKNRVAISRNVLEIPVTVFERRSSHTVAGLPFRVKRTFVKTDVDWASLSELMFFIEEAKRHNIRIMNFFMHSYSFIRFSDDFSRLEVNRQTIDKFEKVISLISEDPEVSVVTMRDLFSLYQQNPVSLLDSYDYVPLFRQQTRLIQRFGRLLVRSGKKPW